MKNYNNSKRKKVDFFHCENASDFGLIDSLYSWNEIT